jgi:hypothetical protein
MRPSAKHITRAEEKWVAISASDTMFSRFFERRLAIFLRPMMRGSSGGFGECNDSLFAEIVSKMRSAAVTGALHPISRHGILGCQVVFGLAGSAVEPLVRNI